MLAGFLIRQLYYILLKEGRYMTKVTIVSGFLGAGKTTFIKELISKVYGTEKIVLIENEFGEIGVDSHFMQNTGIQVTEMNSGCICCTLIGDFSAALQQVILTYHPDRVIIEPSGVGKLSDVAAAIEALSDSLQAVIDARITVVDGKKARLFIQNFGEFFNNQIEYATTIVISRTQIMEEHRLQECVDLLRKHNRKAPIITTPWEQLSETALKEALHQGRNLEEEMMASLLKEENGSAHHVHSHDHDHGLGHDAHHCEHDHHQEHSHDHEGHEHEHEHEHDHSHNPAHDHHHADDHAGHCCCGHGHHHADEIFESWGTETIRKYSRKELSEILEKLDDARRFGTVLRAKGILQEENGTWLEFDMVPGEQEIRERQPDYTGRICVIGAELEKEALSAVFHP